MSLLLGEIKPLEGLWDRSIALFQLLALVVINNEPEVRSAPDQLS